MNTAAITPPKRSLWPYAIAAYFAVAITGIAIFITWAVKQNMDLVRSDYYEQEILFQSHIDAVNRTKALGTTACIRPDAKSRSLLLRVPAAHVAPRFAGTLHLYRPSDAKLDCNIDFRPNSVGEQTVNFASLASGLWKARLEWSANGELYVMEQSLMIVE